MAKMPLGIGGSCRSPVPREWSIASPEPAPGRGLAKSKRTFSHAESHSKNRRETMGRLPQG